jgi:hypothetical protein
MTKNLSIAVAVAVAVAPFVAGLGCAFNPSNLESTTGTTGTGGSHPIPGLTSLSISPTSATLSVSSGGPTKTQQYKVTGIVNGHSQDVTGQVGYSVNTTGIVNVSNSGLATTTNTSGGVVVITATSGGVTATAVLTVVFGFTGPDPGMAGQGVPANSGTIFGTTKNDASRAPQLVYPNDHVLFPPNVTGIEIHFMPGSSSNTLYEVSFKGPVSTINTFIRCQSPQGINGCIYLPDATLWRGVAISNAGQGEVALTVRGTDDTGSSVGNSATFHMTFSKSPIEGALYYWTTSGKTAIMRWDFGGSTTTAVSYLTPTNTGGTCVGCHALSPDGTKVVASAGGQSDGRLLLWDIVNDTALQPFPLAQKSQFESWNADGSQFVGVYGDATKKGPSNLMIFDGTTGAVVSTIDLGGLRADHPDWSKNMGGANTIAFTSVDPVASTTDQRPATGAIDFVQNNGGTWGAPQTLVAAELGKNHYYPAIAPDGNLLVYDESTCTNGTPTAGQPADKSCDADTDATATIMFTSLQGNTPIPLANANLPGVADGSTTALTNSFPKWAPFVEQLDEQSQLVWLTFSSTRQYGLRTPPTPASMDETNKGTLIWMVGVRPSIGGGDPSFTAFCLPFQDITTSNHIAQWTKVFIKGPG